MCDSVCRVLLRGNVWVRVARGVSKYLHLRFVLERALCG